MQIKGSTERLSIYTMIDYLGTPWELPRNLIDTPDRLEISAAIFLFHLNICLDLQLARKAGNSGQRFE